MNTPQPQNKPSDKADIAVRAQTIERAVNIYGLMLLRYIQGFTHDRPLSEDILQTLWIKVFESFPIEQIMELGMLKRKARQLVVDECRSATLHNKTVITVAVLPEIDGNYVFRECATPEDEKRLKNRFWDLFRGLSLTDEQKDAFWLKERYGYTIIDISNHLHVPLSTVGEWIQKVKHDCAIIYKKESI
jgi:DNA-directed RNA polymerase specialized sigma24 family protein